MTKANEKQVNWDVEEEEEVVDNEMLFKYFID